MIKDLCLLGLVFGAILGVVYHALGTPEVEYSWSTKQCVRVVYMDGTFGSCDKLPSKFDKVWVK